MDDVKTCKRHDEMVKVTADCIANIHSMETNCTAARDEKKLLWEKIDNAVTMTIFKWVITIIVGSFLVTNGYQAYKQDRIYDGIQSIELKAAEMRGEMKSLSKSFRAHADHSK